MTKEIKLSRGKVALVSDCDFEWLNQFNWFYSQGRAVRNTPRINGVKSGRLMHRDIMALQGLTPEHVDHVNGIATDNRRENLREATPSTNSMNSKVYVNNNTGVTGVGWDKSRSKWRARIMLGYKDMQLGRFDTFEEAVKARHDAEDKYFKEFAYRTSQIP